MNRKFRVFSFFLLTLLLIFSLSTTALADTGFSSLRYVTLNGYTYSFRSAIANNTAGQITAGQIYAEADIAVENGVKAPTGYMGIRARLYSETGVLTNYTAWTYNTSPSVVLFAHSSYAKTSGYFYSKGAVKLYNGDGYDIYDCYATPNFAPTKSASTDSAIAQINASGEIYGSELFLNQEGIQPDLILAEGIDGTIGYVRIEDLEQDEATTLEDVLSFMEHQQSPRSIPLYNSDGITIIGTFIIG